MAYSKIAATPDGSSSYFLPRLIGLRRAMELYFTNRVLTAREALEWGLVTRVVPDAELRPAVAALAAELAQGPTKAYGAAKRLLHQSTWEVWRPRWSWRPRPSPPPATPRTSVPASPPSPRSRRRRSRTLIRRAGILKTEDVMKPRLYYRPG